MIRTFLLLVALAAMTLIAPWAVMVAALVLLPFYGRARRTRPGPVPVDPEVIRPPSVLERAPSALEHRFRLISGGLGG